MRVAVANLLLAAVYVAAARLGLAMDAVSGFATLVWPPAGIALAVLLRGGVKLAPGVAIGALIVNVWTGAPVLAACGIAIGNTAEVVVGAWGLQRLGFRDDIGRVRDVFALGAAAALSTVIAATIGVTSLWLADTVPAGFGPTWRAWWLGDAIGVLTFAPLLLSWRARPRFDARAAAEALAITAACTLLALIVFTDLVDGVPDPLRLPYMVFPGVMWAALRFESRGVTATTVLVAAIAVAGTASGTGTFARATLHEGLFYLQAFVGVLAVTGLVLGAAIAERRAATALREEFLSIASHELRTPLAALVLVLTDAQSAIADGIDPAKARVPAKIDRAVRATNRLTRLIDGLLDVARIGNGKLELSREDCDLADIVKDVVDRAGEEAKKTHTPITVHVDPARGRWDRLRIEQVVSNLVGNAMKYGAGHPIEVSVVNANGRALLAVRDHGIGIAAVDLERIFDRFERAASVRHYGGLGLGLYIARRIVDAHGGRIEATSTPGEGSLFAVELPLFAAADGG